MDVRGPLGTSKLVAPWTAQVLARRLLELSEALLLELCDDQRSRSVPRKMRERAPPKRLDFVGDTRVRRALETVRSQPVLSIQRLAKVVGLCPDHLQRLFRKETGGGQLREHVVGSRLQRAAELLSMSNMSIKEIAYNLGYKHPSSFVRAFQRVFAQTPGHYRQGAARTVATQKVRGERLSNGGAC